MYHFGDIIEFKNFNLDNIFIDEKSYQNILIYNILYKRFVAAKLLLIRLD